MSDDFVPLVDQHGYPVDDDQQEFWILPLDGYGQPSGHVVTLNRSEYAAALEDNMPFLYTDYWSACARAQD